MKNKDTVLKEMASRLDRHQIGTINWNLIYNAIRILLKKEKV